MKDNKLVTLSVEFSIEAISLCDKIEGHYSLKNQFERSATSIGANIHEANYARSMADFISKLSISLSECYETEYWLYIFKESKIIDEAQYIKLNSKCGTIRRVLISSITTAKKNLESV